MLQDSKAESQGLFYFTKFNNDDGKSNFSLSANLSDAKIYIDDGASLQYVKKVYGRMGVITVISVTANLFESINIMNSI